MNVTNKQTFMVKLFLNYLGLAFLTVNATTMLYVFASILDHGYFMAYETNLFVLSVEIFLQGFGILYVFYLIYKHMKSTSHILSVERRMQP